MPETKIIQTEELLNTINNSNTIIIDIRNPDAYNGWKEDNELRGGHIKNAKNLPYKWSKYIDWIEIIKSKNIVPEASLVIYGYDKQKIDTIAEQLKKLQYNNISVYYNFKEEWSANSALPMENLPKFKHLVPSNWVHSLIKTKKVPETNSTQFVICHCHYQNREDYELGHIPGAIEIDSNTLESQETWNRKSPHELKEAFEAHGITYDTTVIVYGRFSNPDNNDPFPGSSAGHLSSIRCAAIMMYAGVKDVRVLNGGMQSWLDDGFDITTEETPKKPVSDFGLTIPGNPEYFIDIEEAKNYLNSKDKNLISIRSWAEYIGEVSGYNYIKKKGRIPGSIFGNCGSDAYHMENYRNLDHTMREYHETEQILSDVGVTSNKSNAFYCGTGWRGSEAFFNAWLMGWPNIAIFDGGWYEWSNDDNNPYETGKPTNEAKE